MTSALTLGSKASAWTGGLLISGVLVAALTDAVAGTALSLGRGDIIGDIYTTPDEFAWLDIGYTSMKILGFLLAPWILGRLGARPVLIGALLTMGIACLAAALIARLDVLVGCRILQGLSGGFLLVVAQTVLFRAWPRTVQPIVQALFAIGAVVAPATLAPALQGWLIDTNSWAWVFLSVVPLTLLAAGMILLSSSEMGAASDGRRFDLPGILLLGVSLFCFTYVLHQGARWDWFETPRVLWLSIIGSLTLIAFIGQQRLAGPDALLNLDAYRSDDFIFAFLVSFVAGAALFGSAYLIPAFAISVLDFTPTGAGLLLLPSGGCFIATLLFAALLIQGRGLPPIAMAPLGILLTMAAMWMLAGSTHESGADDMMLAMLLRGLGLGLLFLSITLIAFKGLGGSALPSGIGFFNAGRQLGALMGVAALQTLIDQDLAANQSALAANLHPGSLAVSTRIASVTEMLVGRGMNSAEAGHAAIGLLQRTVTSQATVLAFETAFAAVALLFVVAAPLMIAIRISLAKTAWRRAVGTADDGVGS
jgi:MFS transporter, DHA2 family, multidrug resistance protein